MKKITAYGMMIVIIIIIAIITNKIGTENNEFSTSDMTSGQTAKVYERNPDVKDPLLVGIPNVSFPPMIIWDENKNLTGFEIELIKETARRLGVTYEIVPIYPGTEREKLEDSVIDCVLGMVNTGKQRLFYNMTDPYITIPQSAVIYEGSALKDTAALKSISVIMSSGAEILADEDKIGINFKNISASKDYTEAFARLAGGRSDAVICDRTLAVYMQKSDGKFTVLNENVAEADYSIAFSYKEDKMRAAVDNVLKDIFGDGIISKLSQKWFGYDYLIKQTK